MVEFRGVVNINEQGEIVCFCSLEEALRGQCLCQNKYDCPEAIISVETLPGTKPSERGIRQVVVDTERVAKEVTKIKEGLSRLEQAVKKTKFRL
jgi:hypothetical protein